MGIITAGALIIAGLVFAVGFKKSKINKAAPLATTDITDNSNIADLQKQSHWWNALTKQEQRELALTLTQMALPVWNKYTASINPSYKDSTSVALKFIDKNLLDLSLQSIQNQSVSAQADAYYLQFIGPVVALQDGDWLPAFPVKKIFLSCYNLLKGSIDSNKADAGNYFSLSIEYALDCIDKTKLYSKDELDNQFKKYRAALN